MVLRELGSGTLDVFENAIKGHGIRLSDLNIEMNFGTTEGIKHFVEHSDCMGIISIRSIFQEVHDNKFKVLDIEGCKIQRQFCFVEKRGATAGIARMFKFFITKGYSG